MAKSRWKSQQTLKIRISTALTGTSAPPPPADPDSENDNIVTLRALTYLDYEQGEPHADILVTAGRKHFCSTSSRDWPVLDVLFGRMAWKKFANAFAAENASDWDFDEEE